MKGLYYLKLLLDQEEFICKLDLKDVCFSCFNHGFKKTDVSNGKVIDPVELTLLLTPQKLEKTNQLCIELCRVPQVLALELTKLIGLLSSTAQALIPVENTIMVSLTSSNSDPESDVLLSAANSIECQMQTRTVLVDSKFKFFK